MDIKSKIKKTVAKAPRITIYGVCGIGKSTLASCFPKPLFLFTEESALVGVDSIDPPSTYTEMGQNVRGLLEIENLPYKTIVVDSISKLDRLVVDEVMRLDSVFAKENNKKEAKSIVTALGGYGAGYSTATRLHCHFKSVMDLFQNKGISVVYVAHVASVKFKAPDMDDYDKYSIVMSCEKSREPYVDDVDAVFFCKNRSLVSTTESGRNIVKTLDDKIILTNVSDGHTAKNRFNMPPEIPMNFDEIKKYIPFYNNTNNQ